jgi:hypothetical protein
MGKFPQNMARFKFYVHKQGGAVTRVLNCRVEPVARNRRTAPTLQPGEIERAEPDTELHCSPVLRSDVVTTHLRQGYGGQAGDSERRRGGAQRRPPPPLGLSKAHIPARQRKWVFTFGVPWRFHFKEERGQSARLRRAGRTHRNWRAPSKTQRQTS